MTIPISRRVARASLAQKVIFIGTSVDTQATKEYQIKSPPKLLANKNYLRTARASCNFSTLMKTCRSRKQHCCSMPLRRPSRTLILLLLASFTKSGNKDFRGLASFRAILRREKRNITEGVLPYLLFIQSWYNFNEIPTY